jgi:hypothetical protein
MFTDAQLCVFNEIVLCIVQSASTLGVALGCASLCTAAGAHLIFADEAGSVSTSSSGFSVEPVDDASRRKIGGRVHQ